MSLNKIFIDKDILEDVIEKHHPYHKVSSELFVIYCDDVRSEVFTSSLIIKELLDTLIRKYEKNKVLTFVEKILASIQVLEYGASEIKAASILMRKHESLDFSTALNAIILKNNRCTTIISRASFYLQTSNLKMINPSKLIDRY